MSRLHSRVQANNFEVIMIKCYKIFSTTAFLNFNHTITLVLNLVLCDYFVPMLQELRDLKLAFFGAKGIVIDIWAIFSHQVEVSHVTLGKLVHILDSKPDYAESAL